MARCRPGGDCCRNYAPATPDRRPKRRRMCHDVPWSSQSCNLDHRSRADKCATVHCVTNPRPNARRGPARGSRPRWCRAASAARPVKKLIHRSVYGGVQSPKPQCWCKCCSRSRHRARRPEYGRVHFSPWLARQGAGAHRHREYSCRSTPVRNPVVQTRLGYILWQKAS